MSLLRAGAPGIIGGAAGLPPMGNPTVLGTPLADGTSAATRTYASVSPEAGASLWLVQQTRTGSTDRSHSSVSAAFATVSGFAKIAEVGEIGAGSNWIRTSFWRAVATSSPGSGELDMTYSGNIFQALAVLLQMVGGELVATAVDTDYAGNSLSAAFDDDIDSGDLVISALAVANVASGTSLGSVDDISGSPFTSGDQIRGHVGWRRGSAADPQTASKSTANRAATLVAVALRGGPAP